jgi:hypothetical protein
MAEVGTDKKSKPLTKAQRAIVNAGTEIRLDRATAEDAPAATSKSPTRDRVKIPHLAAAGRGMITRCDASWQDVPQIL